MTNPSDYAARAYSECAKLSFAFVVFDQLRSHPTVLLSPISISRSYFAPIINTPIMFNPIFFPSFTIHFYVCLFEFFNIHVLMVEAVGIAPTSCLAFGLYQQTVILFILYSMLLCQAYMGLYLHICPIHYNNVSYLLHHV